MRELLETVRAWQAEGATLGRAVVVRTFGSAPRPEGATLAVTADGRLAGSVSGGCVEGAAYEEIQAACAAGVSRVIRYGISDEQAWDVGLACGGTIDILVEPYLRPEVRLHEDVDRAAAGKTHVPGLLVTDPVADDAAHAGRTGGLDLLVRGAFHAAARDAPGQPPVRRDGESCALRSRRRTERPNDDRPAERRALRLPRPDRLQKLPHQLTPWSSSVPAAAPTPGLPASRRPPPAGPRPAAGPSARVPVGPSPASARGARAASPLAAAARCCPAPSRREPPRAARARRSTGSAGSRRSTGRRPPCPPRSAGSPRRQRAG